VEEGGKGRRNPAVLVLVPVLVHSPPTAAVARLTSEQQQRTRSPLPKAICLRRRSLPLLVRVREAGKEGPDEVEAEEEGQGHEASSPLAWAALLVLVLVLGIMVVCLEWKSVAWGWWASVAGATRNTHVSKRSRQTVASCARPVSCAGAERGEKRGKGECRKTVWDERGLNSLKANKCGFQKKGYGHASRLEQQHTLRLLVIKQGGGEDARRAARLCLFHLHTRTKRQADIQRLSMSNQAICLGNDEKTEALGDRLEG